MTRWVGIWVAALYLLVGLAVSQWTDGRDVATLAGFVALICAVYISAELELGSSSFVSYLLRAKTKVSS